VEALETERLLLEPWGERHRSKWRRICSDPEIMRFIGSGETWVESHADEVFDEALDHWHEHGFGWRSAIAKASGEWLGFVGLNYLGAGAAETVADEVEIGWWIVRHAWSQGFATEGALELRDEGFRRVALGRIVARVQPKNTSSARVAHKIGMHAERKSVGRHGEQIIIYSLSRLEPLR
jgi:ribosomal-protein-alanine N-acetyltransferase